MRSTIKIKYLSWVNCATGGEVCHIRLPCLRRDYLARSAKVAERAIYFYNLTAESQRVNETLKIGEQLSRTSPFNSQWPQQSSSSSFVPIFVRIFVGLRAYLRNQVRQIV